MALRGEEPGKKDLLFWTQSKQQAKSSETPLFNNDCNQLKEWIFICSIFYSYEYLKAVIISRFMATYHRMFFWTSYAKYIKSSMYNTKQDYESMLSHFENSIMEAD